MIFMTASSPIRILVVEDHSIVRESLVTMLNLQDDMKVVAEASTGEEAVKIFSMHKPDVTLMDLRMAGMSGVEAINEIRKESPESRFIVLTTYEGDDDIYKAMKAGIQGYMLKGMYFQELLETIRAVHQGATRIPLEIGSRIANRIGSEELTPRETEVLQLLAEGLSNKGIAERLKITPNTIRTYLTSIFGKMGVEDRTQAVTLAIKRGIVHLR
jgi:DNA-binding NarL/FixJ family response regulator